MVPTFKVMLAAGIAFLIVAGAPGSADPTVYPAKGQSAGQQNKDKFECFQWAKNQTGFDPMSAAGTAAPPPQGGAVRGAGRGAAAGAVGGAIAGDAGKGAAIGAGIGAVGGGMKRRQGEQAQQQA